MRNKIEILSEELQNHFSGIAVDLFEILFPELTKEGLRLPPMRGRGFFPGADGLWKEDKDQRPLSPTVSISPDNVRWARFRQRVQKGRIPGPDPHPRLPGGAEGGDGRLYLAQSTLAPQACRNLPGRLFSYQSFFPDSGSRRKITARAQHCVILPWWIVASIFCQRRLKLLNRGRSSFWVTFRHRRRFTGGYRVARISRAVSILTRQVWLAFR
jgi:hypothetical protein